MALAVDHKPAAPLLADLEGAAALLFDPRGSVSPLPANTCTVRVFSIARVITRHCRDRDDRCDAYHQES